MGSGFSKMKKHFKQFEKQLDTLHQQTFTGHSSNELVTVVITGNLHVKQILIKPECVQADDIEGLQDLLIQASNRSLEQIQKAQKEHGLITP